MTPRGDGPPAGLAAAGLVMVGFAGTSPDAHVKNLVRAGVAGVILFGRNVADLDQVRDLVRELQDEAAASGHPPLIVAVDQEGGRVRRLRNGATAFPSAMALGAVGDPAEVYSLSREIAAELLSAGINCNLAPCADVNSDPENPVIGTRSYGQRPEQVAGLVAAAVRGYQDGGLIATAKHFPGHGATKFDSHLTLPVIDRSVDELEAVDLVPFRAAVKAGVRAVMSAHIVFPPLTGDLPATLSRAALTGLLRERLGYQGLVLTDCMEMAGARAGGDPSRTTVQAVRAGADLVLWSHTPALQDRAIGALAEAAAAERDTGARVAASYRRVRSARGRLHWASPGVKPGAPAGGPCGSGGAAADQGAQGVGLAARSNRLACQAITIVRDCRGILPLGDPQVAITVGDLARPPTGPDPSPGALLEAELRAMGYSVSLRTVLAGDGVRWVLDRASQGDRVICLTRDAVLDPPQAALAGDVLASCPGAILVATGLPYDVRLFPSAQCCLCTYDADQPAIRGLAGVLAGRVRATGRLPVCI